ncbi:MAG TPA: cytochrome c [bacterium]|nr:cytochrome c [bacterium]
MKTNIVLTVGCWILFICIGCAGSLSQKTMTEGERLYRARCRSCHSLINPNKYSDSSWELFVEKYGQNINLTEKESRLILEYLTENN